MEPQTQPALPTVPSQAVRWHAVTTAETIHRLGTDINSGLTETEARQRLAQVGPNRLREEKHESIWETVLEEVREPLILLLLFTGVLYSVFGEVTDALTIFFVIFTLMAIEVFNERRAEQAIAALHKLAEPTALVQRGGQLREIPAEELVPGDLILLEAGRRVPADARLVEGYGVSVDESSLTGESVPVEKEAEVVVQEQTPLAERRNLFFAGTTLVRGRARAVVVSTGMSTELGRVAGLTRQVKAPPTPLQKTMRELTGWMVWLALGFSVMVPILGVLLAGQSLQQMILTGLSLAFATIPEEGPIIITMVLALGGYRLSKQQAIVRKLKAVETLGAVTVIATDKTGTLTENRMEVNRAYPELLQAKLLELGVLCNDAAESDSELKGDPMEVALLRAARQAGLDVEKARCDYSLTEEFTFDNARKRMSVVRERDSRAWAIVKGAPESVLPLSNRQWIDSVMHPLTQPDRQAMLATAAQMAEKGLRVIALAEKEAALGSLTQERAESDLTFVGLVGLADPPRPEVRQAIADCRTAGIRTIMVTGDHPLTARAVAGQVDLNGNGRVLTGPELDQLSAEELREAVGQVSVFGRTTPEHKLRIVHALHERRERVAVTGDGTNDAPALVAADIGIAMGETGSDVARDAGDLVLADDNFATIVRAVSEGRLLYANLKKALRYYLSCKVALVSATLLPVLLRVPVPFAPVQIILMELFMDLAASATFVVEPSESDLMRRPPRDPKQPFMDRAMTTSIFGSAAGLFAAVSVVYLFTWCTSGNLAKAQTLAFITWLLGHVFLAVNLRSEREPVLRVGLFSNPLMILWGAATVLFVLLITFAPGAQLLFKTSSVSGQGWVLAIGAAFLGTFWIEGLKWFRRALHNRA